ncbi:UNVERIFIED_CONTAM: hypothetical protein NCL1_16893 [Trichonephila clavipes]
MCRSKGGNQRKASLSSANNFMVIHPGQTIIDKNIDPGSRKPTHKPPAELMANADYDALKKPLNVFFYFKPLPKATQCEKKKKKKKRELKLSYKHTHQRNVRTKGKAEQETLKKQRREAREAKKGMSL